MFVVEAQGVGERGDHARRGSGVAALLEPNEVVDADAGEGGDFFSAQTRRSPASVVGQSDVGRLELLAAGAEELGHSRHITSMPYELAYVPGPVSTRIIPAFSDRPRELIMWP